MISRALWASSLLYFFALAQLQEAKPQQGKKESLTSRGNPEMWYSSFDEYQRLNEPTFDNNTVVNNTVQLGGTAFLHCRVRNLGERTITWVRRRDWHILTSGLFTYTNDERFQVLHAEGSDDWTLQIKYVQKRDNGTYECQVHVFCSRGKRYRKNRSKQKSEEHQKRHTDIAPGTLEQHHISR